MTSRQTALPCHEPGDGEIGRDASSPTSWPASSDIALKYEVAIDRHTRCPGMVGLYFGLGRGEGRAFAREEALGVLSRGRKPYPAELRAASLVRTCTSAIH